MRAIIDEAASALKMEIESVPTPIDQLKRRILTLEVEKAALQSESGRRSKERLPEVQKEIADLSEAVKAMTAQWQDERKLIERIRTTQAQAEEAKGEAERAQREADRAEAEAAAKLHHTNIVPIYWTSEENRVPYYAMELIDGPSLDQVINEGIAAENSSGVWGAVVSSIIGTAEFLGEKATLKALKSGEKHGLNEYKSLLESRQLSRGQKRQVREYFIPQQQRHVAKLESMLSN